MLHTVAFSGALAATSTSLQNIPGVSDPTLTVSGNFIYMPALSSLVGEYVVGASVSQAQLQAPSLKSFANYDLSPIDQSAAPSNPVRYTPHYSAPFALQPNEGLQAFVVNSSSKSDKNSVVIELADGAITPVSPVGVMTVRATFTVTAGDYTWANSALTFSQTLPVGKYNCVGARVEVLNGIWARFFPVGGVYRPGVHVSQDVSDEDSSYERRGGKGTLFTFDQLTPPSIDLFHNGASGTGVVYLDLVKAA